MALASLGEPYRRRDQALGDSSYQFIGGQTSPIQGMVILPHVLPGLIPVAHTQPLGEGYF
jgi:hypothetical protein